MTLFAVFRTWNFFEKKRIVKGYYATFHCRHYGVFKKIIKNLFTPKKGKKRASKVADNRPRPFYFVVQSSPDHSPQPIIDFTYHEISGPDICSLIFDVLWASNFYVVSVTVLSLKYESISKCRI